VEELSVAVRPEDTVLEARDAEGMSRVPEGHRLRPPVCGNVLNRVSGGVGPKIYGIILLLCARCKIGRLILLLIVKDLPEYSAQVCIVCESNGFPVSCSNECPPVVSVHVHLQDPPSASSSLCNKEESGKKEGVSIIFK
jgi:hypothetical protein